MASDHRGRELHAGKRTAQEYPVSPQEYQMPPAVDDYTGRAYGGWQDPAGPANRYSPRKPSPKSPQNMGATKAY